MTGYISSAQARDLKPDTSEQKASDGTVSSHDLLRQDENNNLRNTDNNNSTTVSDTAGESAPVASAEEKLDASVQQKPESQNFRQVRERAEAAERAAREKEEQLQQLLKLSRQQQQDPQKANTFDPDEVIYSKDLQPVAQDLQEIKRKLAYFEQATTVEQSKNNLRKAYNDYDQVMTPDNLKDLEYMDPQMANALKTSGDFEGASKIAYNMIKAMGIYKDTTATSSSSGNYEYEKQRAKENLAKPKPAQAIGKSNSPLGALSPYHREQTKEHKDMLWANMQKRMRAKKSF